ncbi:alpha/beta hydrolase [Rosettibacter firmus]|uniref:alpha/beta hydrolase n=1 Tax=Rosettibacter firmus TaxID=3111522 RepID=UPI00336BC3C2
MQLLYLMKFNFIFVLILFAQDCNVLEENSTLMISFKMFSENVKDTFQIDISFPESYSKNTNQKYPVLFLTDGNWRRDQHKTIHELSKQKVIKELVIVGIGYPDSYNPNIIRKRDLIEHADKFLNFICDELIPHIENKYRVTNERTLWGSSFGGFFGMYALFNYVDKTKNVFNNYIIVSPAAKEKTFYNNQYLDLFDLEKILYSRTKELEVNLYMAVGGNEDPERFLDPFKDLIDILQKRNYKNFYMKSYIDAGKDHYTVWEPALYEGVKMFFGINKL